MMVTLAGAMSTAELGRSLADMIRADKVDAITCTGANLEEDLFNLVAHHHYVRLPNYRDLTPEDEQALLARQLNRVTDTCIPEEEAMRAVERAVLEGWQRAEGTQRRAYPHEYLYELLLERRVEFSPSVDPRLLAAGSRRAACRSSCRAGKTRRWATCLCASPRRRPRAVGRSPQRFGGDVGFSRLVPTSHQGGQRIGFPKSVEGSQAISRSASCHCFTKTSGSGTDRSGLTFARSPTRRPRTAPTRAPSPMELPGVSSASRHRSFDRATPIVAPLIFAWVLASDLAFNVDGLPEDFILCADARKVCPIERLRCHLGYRLTPDADVGRLSKGGWVLPAGVGHRTHTRRLVDQRRCPRPKTRRRGVRCLMGAVAQSPRRRAQSCHGCV